MKKQPIPTILTLILICLIPFSVSAQPVLTYSNNAPQPGEIYVAYEIANPPMPALLTATGPNYLWDFSNISAGGGIIYSHYPPIMTQFGNLFPQATVTCQQPLWWTTLVYLQADSTQLLEVGHNNMIWDNPRTLITYPFTYGNFYIDTASYFSPPIDWIWQVSGIADGYGSVILPYGVVHNVLRISEEVNRFSGVGWVLEQSYFWYQPGTSTPICFFWGDPIERHFYYREPAVFSGLDEINKNTTPIVYPNPFTDFLQVEFQSDKAGQFDILLQDARGRVVYQQLNQTCQQGPNKFDLTPGQLEQGTYVLVLSGSNILQQCPVVVVK